jgi:hypothetical protein
VVVDIVAIQFIISIIVVVSTIPAVIAVIDL